MERVLIFKPDTTMKLVDAADSVNSYLKEGWKVKNVITEDGIVVFVLDKTVTPDPDDDDEFL